MKGADDSAGEKDRRGEHDGARRGGHREQLQAGEEERDHHRGEHFEKAFHPEMHHPPSPVFRGDQIAALAVHQAGGVEKRDRDTREQEHQQQRVALVSFQERRLQSAPHQPQPESKSAEQQNLPEAAQVHVLVTLRAEPEPQVAELVFNAHPLAGERTNHDENQRAEQNVDAQPLALRFNPADGRCDVEPGCQP